VEYARQYFDDLTRFESQKSTPTMPGLIVTELERIRVQCEILHARLAKLEEDRDRVSTYIEISDVPKEEARGMVESFLKTYLRENRQVFPSDVADALGLRYETVCEVFCILEKEGKLKGS
jgi:hypothetical protein